MKRRTLLKKEIRATFSAIQSISDDLFDYQKFVASQYDNMKESEVSLSECNEIANKTSRLLAELIIKVERHTEALLHNTMSKETKQFLLDRIARHKHCTDINYNDYYVKKAFREACEDIQNDFII